MLVCDFEDIIDLAFSSEVIEELNLFSNTVMLKSIYLSNFVHCFPNLGIINGVFLSVFKNLEMNCSFENNSDEDDSGNDLYGRVLLKNLEMFKVSNTGI
jgi:hypothetical protein